MSAREPSDPLRWDYIGTIPSEVPEIHIWQQGLVRVTSQYATMEAPDGSGDIIPTWLISVSRNGKRPKQNDLRRALRAFGMVGSEEDNHHPGVARSFFLVCDPARRVACECKTTEDTIADGPYRWTNPKPETGESCRGCEYEALRGKPCPIHGAPDGPPASPADALPSIP